MTEETGLDARVGGSAAEARLMRLIPELVSAIADMAAERSMVATTELRDHLMSVGGAAELLGVSRTTAYELIRSGSLRSLKVRGRRLVAESAVTAFIAEPES